MKSMCRNKGFFCLLLTLTLLLGLTACSEKKEQPAELIEQDVKTEKVSNDRLSTVERGDYIIESRTGGTIYFPVTAELAWDKEDFRYEEILVEKGDQVSEGDVLMSFVTDSENVQLEEDKLKLERLTEEKEVGIQERQEDIQKATEESWKMSSYAWVRQNCQIQSMQSALDQYICEMDYQIELLKEEISELEKEETERTITAPFNGVIDSVIIAEPGGKVKAGETLITINATDRIALAAENPRGVFQYHQAVTVTVGSQSYTGRVAAASNVLPADYQTEYMVIQFDEGQEVEIDTNHPYSIQIVGETTIARNVLIVDSNTLSLDGGKYYVQIMEDDGAIHRRPVTIGSSNMNGNGTVVWITDGVEEGDKLVVGK